LFASVVFSTEMEVKTWPAREWRIASHWMDRRAGELHPPCAGRLFIVCSASGWGSFSWQVVRFWMALTAKRCERV